MKLISSSEEAATALKIELERRDMLAGPGNDRENIFYASDLSDNFLNMIRLLLGDDVERLNIRFKNLDL